MVGPDSVITGRDPSTTAVSARAEADRERSALNYAAFVPGSLTRSQDAPAGAGAEAVGGRNRPPPPPPPLAGGGPSFPST